MNAYNFTERVRKVLALARDEATRLDHEYVGTEHILLAVIREGGGVAATVFQNLGVDAEEVRQQIEAAVQRGRSHPPPAHNLPYTSRAKKVLELAMTEASQLNHSYVGTEHLLLGLIAESKGIAAQVLIEHAGLTLETVRLEVLRVFGIEPGAPIPPPPTLDDANLGDLVGRPIARVEVILHFRDHSRFQTSFESAANAAGFLRWVDPGGQSGRAEERPRV